MQACLAKDALLAEALLAHLKPAGFHSMSEVHAATHVRDSHGDKCG